MSRTIDIGIKIKEIIIGNSAYTEDTGKEPPRKRTTRIASGVFAHVRVNMTGMCFSDGDKEDTECNDEDADYYRITVAGAYEKGRMEMYAEGSFHEKDVLHKMDFGGDSAESSQVFFIQADNRYVEFQTGGDEYYGVLYSLKDGFILSLTFNARVFDAGDMTDTVTYLFS